VAEFGHVPFHVNSFHFISFHFNIANGGVRINFPFPISAGQVYFCVRNILLITQGPHLLNNGDVNENELQQQKGKMLTKLIAAGSCTAPKTIASSGSKLVCLPFRFFTFSL